MRHNVAWCRLSHQKKVWLKEWNLQNTTFKEGLGIGGVGVGMGVT